MDIEYKLTIWIHQTLRQPTKSDLYPDINIIQDMENGFTLLLAVKYN